MAVIQSTFAMEDRVSSTLSRIEGAMTSATHRFETSSQSIALWQNKVDGTEVTLESMAIRLAEAEQAQANLDAAMRSGDPSSYFEATTDSSLMTADAFAKLAAQHDALAEKQEQNMLNLQKASDAHGNAAQKVGELSGKYQDVAESERIAAELAEITARANRQVSDAVEQHIDSQDKLEPAIGKHELAMQRYQAQMQVIEQRVEMYRDKMDATSTAMQTNAIILEQLNALQEQTYNSARQNEIEQIIRKQEQLTVQYQQQQIAMQGAENQYMNAASRMMQASGKLNPMISGLSMGMSSLGGNAARFGQIGVQALAGVTAGAKATTVALTATNAAFGMGIGLLVSLGIQALVSLFSKTEEVKEATESLDSTTKDYQYTVSAMSGHIRTLTSDYRNMNTAAANIMETYIKSKEAIERKVTAGEMNAIQLEKYAAEYEELISKTERTAAEQDRLLFIMASMNNTIPGLIGHMQTETGELGVQTGVVWQLVTAYIALADAKREAAIADKLGTEALERQRTAEWELRKATQAQSIVQMDLWKEQRSHDLASQAAINKQQAKFDELKAQYPSEEAFMHYLMNMGYDPYGETGTERARDTLFPLEIIYPTDVFTAAIEANEKLTQEIAGHQNAVRDFGAEFEFYTSGLDRINQQIADYQKTFIEHGIDPRKLLDAGGFGIDMDVYMPEWKDFLGDFTTSAGGGKALRTSGEVSFDNESLQMLHDISRREYQVRYQQVVPQVLVTIDKVEETADIDLLVEKVADGLAEAAGSRLDVGVAA